ncbi:unnamed protein product [Ectocarpus sp. 8 AP-2014]
MNTKRKTYKNIYSKCPVRATWATHLLPRSLHELAKSLGTRPPIGATISTGHAEERVSLKITCVPLVQRRPPAVVCGLTHYRHVRRNQQQPDVLLVTSNCGSSPLL